MKKQSVIKLIFQKRMLIILLLGVASGMPLGLCGTTLQAWYSVENLSFTTIGFLALVGQPYIYKFIWAPTVDRYEPLALFGMKRRRGWMIVTQCLIVFLLIAMACFKPSEAPLMLALLALGLSFVAATQDIVIDAYRTEILSEPERGCGAAMGVAGYRIAMLISGGLALVLAQYCGFQMTFLLMAGCMSLSLLVSLKSEEPTMYAAPPLNFKQACILPFVEFLNRKNALALLSLVMLYKLGDAFAGALTTTFLLREAGFSLVEVGLINKTLGLAGTLLGVFCGGVMLSRTALFKALLGFGIIQALSNLTYMGLIWVPGDYSLMSVAVFLENFGGGLGTAAFCALIMSLCDKRYTATQFALLSALTAVGRVYVGPIAGLLVESFGWSQFFIWSLVVSTPGLLLLFWLREKIEAPLEANL